METLQEYQAGILERVKNFPRGGIPRMGGGAGFAA